MQNVLSGKCRQFVYREHFIQATLSIASFPLHKLLIILMRSTIRICLRRTRLPFFSVTCAFTTRMAPMQDLSLCTSIIVISRLVRYSLFIHVLNHFIQAPTLLYHIECSTILVTSVPLLMVLSCHRTRDVPGLLPRI